VKNDLSHRKNIFNSQKRFPARATIEFGFRRRYGFTNYSLPSELDVLDILIWTTFI
jgi:hypothetical protein